MEKFKECVVFHAKKYPKMQPQDLLKLAIQSCRGNFHAARLSEDILLESLKKELNNIHLRADAEPFEDLGRDYIRIDLSCLEISEIPPEILNRMFVLSASAESSRELDSYIKCCRELAENGIFSFSANDFMRYVESFSEEIPSHSSIYKREYSPSYRVISSAWKDLIPIIARICVLKKETERVILAIDGMAASGKTTAAELISRLFSAPTIHADHFFLPFDMRSTERLSEIGGNFHRERFLNEVIENIRSGKSFTYRVFDCKSGDLSKTVEIPVSDLLIIEGAYCLHPALSDYADIRVCMTIDGKLQSRRILERNGSIMYGRFISEWIPMENRYLEHFGIKETCDFVI